MAIEFTNFNLPLDERSTIPVTRIPYDFLKLYTCRYSILDIYARTESFIIIPPVSRGSMQDQRRIIKRRNFNPGQWES